MGYVAGGGSEADQSPSDQPRRAEVEEACGDLGGDHRHGFNHSIAKQRSKIRAPELPDTPDNFITFQKHRGGYEENIAAELPAEAEDFRIVINECNDNARQ